MEGMHPSHSGEFTMPGQHHIARDPHRCNESPGIAPASSWLGYGFWIAYGLVLLVTISMGVAVLEAAKAIHTPQVFSSVTAMPHLVQAVPVSVPGTSPAAPQAEAALPGPVAMSQPVAPEKAH